MDSFWTFWPLKIRQKGSLKSVGTSFQVYGATSQKNTELYFFLTLKLQSSTFQMYNKVETT